MNPLQNAFTVDVEDYFQVSAFERRVSRDSWSGYSLRVAQNTRRLLDLLAQHQVRGTFFILGWVAEQIPDLVRQIDAAGHSIGSHSYWHRLVYELTPAEFRDDLRRSRDLLQDLIGKPIVSYRAPSFSITQQSLWALDILADEGFQFDSSIYPVHHDRYGIPNAKVEIHSVTTDHGPVYEFPPAVFCWGGWRLPVSGGGYFRLYPYRCSRWFLRQVNASGRPFTFYVHPWEIDPEQPAIQGVSWMSRFRHRVHLRSTLSKLDRLLREFQFSTLEQVVRNTMSPTYHPTPVA